MPSKVRQSQSLAFDDQFSDAVLIQVRRLYIAFAEGVFAAAPESSGYQWSPDRQKTKIYITDESVLDPVSIGMRPGISFTRSPVQTNSIGIGDLTSFDQNTGARTKSVLLPGIMHINVCSRVKLESERLASILHTQLWLNRSELVGSGALFDMGRNFILGPTNYAGSLMTERGEQWYATTVSSPFHAKMTGSTTPLNKAILNHVGARMNVRPVDEPLGPAVGYGVETTAPGVNPPLEPHPLNPARMVTIRRVPPGRPR